MSIPDAANRRIDASQTDASRSSDSRAGASQTDTSRTAAITVELFGTARIRAGRNAASLRVDAQATMPQLARALAQECPALLGNALRAGDVITIADGYVLNRNGLAFLASDGDAPLGLESGDTILLLSSQAGG